MKKSTAPGALALLVSASAVASLAACGGARPMLVSDLPACSERALPADVLAALRETQRVVDTRWADDGDATADLSQLFASALPEGARVVEVVRANFVADNTDELLVLFLTEAENTFNESNHGPATLAPLYGHAWMGGLRCEEGTGFTPVFEPVDLVFDSVPTVRQVDRAMLLNDTPVTAVSVQHELLVALEMIETVYLFGPFAPEEGQPDAGLWDQFEGVGERTLIPGADLWYEHQPLSVSGFFPLGNTLVWGAVLDSLGWSFGDHDDDAFLDLEPSALLDRDEDAPPLAPWEDEGDDDTLWRPTRMITYVPHGVLRDGEVEVWDPYGFIGPEVPWESWALLGHGTLPPDCSKRLACRPFTEAETAVFALGGEQVEWIAGLLPTLAQAQAVADRLDGGALITGFSTQFDWYEAEDTNGDEFPELDEIDPRLRVAIPLPAFPSDD